MSTSTAVQFEIGTRVRLVAKFEDFDDLPASPSTVVAKIIDPAGTQTTPVVTNNTQAEDGVTAEVGTYFADHVVDLAGVWKWRFEGTGAIETAAESEFYVSGTPFT